MQYPTVTFSRWAGDHWKEYTCNTTDVVPARVLVEIGVTIVEIPIRSGFSDWVVDPDDPRRMIPSKRSKSITTIESDETFIQAIAHMLAREPTDTILDLLKLICSARKDYISLRCGIFAISSDNPYANFMENMHVLKPDKKPCNKICIKEKKKCVKITFYKGEYDKDARGYEARSIVSGTALTADIVVSSLDNQALLRKDVRNLSPCGDIREVSCGLVSRELAANIVLQCLNKFFEELLHNRAKSARK